MYLVRNYFFRAQTKAVGDDEKNQSAGTPTYMTQTPVRARTTIGSSALFMPAPCSVALSTPGAVPM